MKLRDWRGPWIAELLVLLAVHNRNDMTWLRFGAGFRFQTATPAIIAPKARAAATHGSIVRSFPRGSTAVTGCANTPLGSAKGLLNVILAHQLIARYRSLQIPFADSGSSSLTHSRMEICRKQIPVQVSALTTDARISVTSSP